MLFVDVNLSKPILYIVLMAAILSPIIAIYYKFLSAVLANNLVVGFTVHIVEVLIPPLISTLIAAEFFLLRFWFLQNIRTTIFAFINHRYWWFICRLPRCNTAFSTSLVVLLFVLVLNPFTWRIFWYPIFGFLIIEPLDSQYAVRNIKPLLQFFLHIIEKPRGDYRLVVIFNIIFAEFRLRSSSFSFLDSLS